MDEKTCLVKKVSRLRWMLCLAGISDPGSKRHRDLLKETPIPLRLGTAAERHPDRHANASVEDLALRQCLEETVSTLREAEAERDAARAAQADLERQLRAARAEVERLRGEAERLCGERDAELAAERERRQLAEDTRAREVAALEGAMKAQAAAANAECRQLEEAVLDRDIMLEDAERQLAALRAEIEAVTNERA